MLLVRLLCLVSTLGALSLGPGLVLAQTATSQYTPTQLGDFSPRAINNRGQIVGSVPTIHGLRSAALWQDGQVSDLGALLSDPSSEAEAINDRGDVVINAFNLGQAFVWQDGRLTALSFGGARVTATAINSSGQVVGYAGTPDGHMHAFIWQAGRMTDLGIEGIATKINNRGQVLINTSVWDNGTLTSLIPPGSSAAANGIVDLSDAGAVIAVFVPDAGIPHLFQVAHAFVWQAGQFTDLGQTPAGGRCNTLPLAINDRGQVAGTLGSFDPGQDYHAFLWQASQFTTLGGSGSVAQAINNRGQVLFTDGNGEASVWSTKNQVALGMPVFVFSINDHGAVIGLSGGQGLVWQPQVRSLRFDGATGYAEVAARPDLNITGDWTVEAWFKDEDPNGFNHDFRQILMKGDRDVDAEAPYYLLVGRNSILAGVRTGGQDYPIVWDMNYLGLDPQQWHHVAVTFRADLNVLNLWLDGNHIAYRTIPAHSTTGNTRPLAIGRNGPVTGKYWLGNIQDVRIWNVARTGAEISASYGNALGGPQPGLVANWHFDEGSGHTAADSAGNQHAATLLGGAAFAIDPHP